MNETSGCKGEVDCGSGEPSGPTRLRQTQTVLRVDVHAAVSAIRMRTASMTHTEAGRPYPKELITET